LFFHFKNHQSSLDTHQSIPRDPHSPFLRLLLFWFSVKWISV
jgi:hypothetical protein